MTDSVDSLLISPPSLSFFLSFFFFFLEQLNQTIAPVELAVCCLKEAPRQTLRSQYPPHAPSPPPPPSYSLASFSPAAGLRRLLRRDNTSGQTMEPTFCQSPSQSIKHNWLSAAMAALINFSESHILTRVIVGCVCLCGRRAARGKATSHFWRPVFRLETCRGI